MSDQAYSLSLSGNTSTTPPLESEDNQSYVVGHPPPSGINVEDNEKSRPCGDETTVVPNGLADQASPMEMDHGCPANEADGNSHLSWSSEEGASTSHKQPKSYKKPPFTKAGKYRDTVSVEPGSRSFFGSISVSKGTF